MTVFGVDLMSIIQIAMKIFSSVGDNYKEQGG